MVGRKIHPQIDHGDAFIKLVKYQLLPLYRKVVLSEETEQEFDYDQKLAQAYEILDNQQVIDILSIVYKQFIPFFKNYWQNGNSRIDLETYLDAMLEFAIYPSLLSRNQWVKLFKYLVEIMKRSEGEFDPWRLVFRDFDDPSMSIDEPDQMDSHMFIESLAMIAFIHTEIQNKSRFHPKILSQRKFIIKILSLWERIAHSIKSYTFSFRESPVNPEEILIQFKKNYPWFWEDRNI